MSEKEISMCFLISSCKREKYESYRLEQYKHLPGNMNLYYVMGNSESSHDKVPNSPYVHVLHAPCGDTYEDITLKLWYGFSYLRNFYDIIIKIDESLLLHQGEHLVDIIMREYKYYPYGALKGIGDIKQPMYALEHGSKVTHPLFRTSLSFYPPMRYAGACYYLTSSVLMLLTKKDFTCFFAEDYAIGYFLKKRYGIDVHPSHAIREKIFIDRPDQPVANVKSITAPNLEPYYEHIFSCVPEDNSCIVSVHGGLANQLFQIAAGLEYSIRYSKRLLLAPKGNNVRSYYWNTVLSRFKNRVLSTQDLGQTCTYTEPCFHYKEIPNIDMDVNVILSGYFQSSKYFETIADDVRKMLHLTAYSPAADNIVVVHARRGDYMTKVEYHAPLSVEYYERAITEIKKHVINPEFVLVSDDNSFWETVPALCQEKYTVFDDDNEINALSFMASAQNFIIANSTFSWWAAKLASSVMKLEGRAYPHVIAPKTWFGPAGPQDTYDIYDSHFTII